jgi:ABC-2 type transport system permease protein
MRNFFRQAYYTYRGLFTWLPWPSYITIFIFGPALTILMFALAGRFALGSAVVKPYVLGMVAQSILYVITGSVVNCFIQERYSATLSIVYASRGNRVVTFFSRQLLHLPNGFVVAASGLFFNRLFIGLDFSTVNWPVLILAVLAISLSACTSAAFLGNFTIVVNDWILLNRAFSGAMLVLTGVIIPLSSFPAWLAGFSHVLPLTHGLVAFRAAFNGAGLQTMWPSLLQESTVALGYAVIGVVGYYLVEIFAKRRGVLGALA